MKENAINKIDDAYESGIYSKEKYRTRIRKAENDLYQAKEQKRLLEVEVSTLAENDTSKRVETLFDFLEAIQNEEATYEEQNKLYKTIIQSIVYTRTESDTINLEVRFK